MKLWKESPLTLQIFYVILAITLSGGTEIGFLFTIISHFRLSEFRKSKIVESPPQRKKQIDVFLFGIGEQFHNKSANMRKRWEKNILKSLGGIILTLRSKYSEAILWSCTLHWNIHLSLASSNYGQVLSINWTEAIISAHFSLVKFSNLGLKGLMALMILITVQALNLPIRNS